MKRNCVLFLMFIVFTGHFAFACVDLFPTSYEVVSKRGFDILRMKHSLNREQIEDIYKKVEALSVNSSNGVDLFMIRELIPIYEEILKTLEANGFRIPNPEPTVRTEKNTRIPKLHRHDKVVSAYSVIGITYAVDGIGTVIWDGEDLIHAAVGDLVILNEGGNYQPLHRSGEGRRLVILINFRKPFSEWPR